jgi:hypothetical protein
MNSISDLRKKRNRIKKQLQKIALIEGHDWRNLVREERPLRKKFIQQWKKHKNGKTNSFFEVASQYANIVSREESARSRLDTKFRPYLERIVDLDCKIQKAKSMTKSHLTPR